MLRLIVSIVLGVAATFALFVLMAKLVENSGRGPDEVQKTPPIEIVMNEPDQTTQKITRVPPPPPPPPQQPPKMAQPEPEQADPNAENLTMSMPSVDVGGTNIDIGAPGAMQRDGDATPIVRIDPKYPIEAQRDGREGWVKLSFTINEVGGVEDVKVIESEPRRIFDKEARRALKKWKYKPKVENGKPVKQPGLTVQLDFKLDGG